MNNKGFTLLEMLIVLFIVGLIFFIMSFNYLSPTYKGHLNKEAMYLGSTLENLELKSLVSNKESYIEVDSQGFRCFLDQEQIYEHNFYAPLNINSNFDNNKISVTDDGTVSKAGSMQLSYKEDKVTLVIDIGVGRYKVE